MINEKNSHLYLRWLVKVSEDSAIRYDEIPKQFLDFYSGPGITQALNLSVKIPEANWSKVEKYIDENLNSFEDFDNLAQGIQNNFQEDIDKLYASYYFVTHYIQYDYPRSISDDRKALSIEKIFNDKKGICADYSKFLRELAKRSGVTSKRMRILPFTNSSKAAGWSSYNPPSQPDFHHEAVYIDIGGEKFVSEPTWGSGSTDENNVFKFNYKKTNFLIPYFTSLLSHYPEKILDESLNHPFTWEQFIALNEPNVGKELSYESNPFQFISVDDGFYEMQFSFLQPCESIWAQIYILEGNTWMLEDNKFVTFVCLRKDLPNHISSFSSELRCRYKMTACFPEIGTYHVKVNVGTDQLFHVYFKVNGKYEKLNGIAGTNKEKYGFMPIVPLEGLSKVTKGYARIRFAIKYNRSSLLIKLFKVKNGKFERESNEYFDDHSHYFTVNLPFEEKDKSNDLNEYLVEDWVLVEFPENGRWEVSIYFANDEGSYTYGVSYFFDVTGLATHINLSIFDLPKSRTFAPMKKETLDDIRVEPSTQSVILDDYDFYFHVFSEKEVKAYFTLDEDNSTVWPSILSEKSTEKKNIKDREFSVTFPKSGTYKLEIWVDNVHFASQNYYVIEYEQQDESPEEKELMQNFRNTLEGKTDYNKDIPISIRKNVEQMLKDSGYNLKVEPKGSESDQNQSNSQSSDKPNKIARAQSKIDLDRNSNKSRNPNQQSPSHSPRPKSHVIDINKYKQSPDSSKNNLISKNDQKAPETKEFKNISTPNQSTVEFLSNPVFEEGYLASFREHAENLTPSEASQYFESIFGHFSEDDYVDDQTARAILRSTRSVIKDDQIYQVFKKSAFSKLPYGRFSHHLYPILRDLIFEHPDIFGADPEVTTSNLVRSFLDDPKKGLSITASAAEMYVKDEDDSLLPVLDVLKSGEVMDCVKSDRKLLDSFLSVIVYLCQNSAAYKDGNCVDWFLNVSDVILSKSSNKRSLRQIYVTLNYLRDCTEDERQGDLNLPIEKMIGHLTTETAQGPILSLLVDRAQTRPSDLNDKRLISSLFKTAETGNLKATLVLMQLSTNESFVKTVFGTGSWLLKGLPTVTDTVRLFLVLFEHEVFRDEMIVGNDHFIPFLNFIIQGMNSSGAVSLVSRILKRVPIDPLFVSQLDRQGLVSSFIETAKRTDDVSRISSYSLLIFLNEIGQHGYLEQYLTTADFVADETKKRQGGLDEVASFVAVTLARYESCRQRFVELDLDAFFRSKVNDKSSKRMAKNAEKFLSIIEEE
ncbi:hypothetical protein M9Y10_001554 [Tritrichomonas musculus]|uniref:Transglutaminase-like domain-containing protein n=1 Tax=Tritrichomonas musculus TaxID=1915356 RepID=A0ABR2L7D6_9EUKA